MGSGRGFSLIALIFSESGCVDAIGDTFSPISCTLEIGLDWSPIGLAGIWPDKELVLKMHGNDWGRGKGGRRLGKGVRFVTVATMAAYVAMSRMDARAQEVVAGPGRRRRRCSFRDGGSGLWRGRWIRRWMLIGSRVG